MLYSTKSNALGILIVLVGCGSFLPAPAAASVLRGWPIGRLPGVDFLGEVDMVCGGTFQGHSEAYDREVQWKAPAGWIARPQTRVAQFRVDDVIKGDQGLTGETIRVLYLASGPRPERSYYRPNGTDFPDLAQKLGKRRCLLQLLSQEDGNWEIRFGGDSYMVLGAKPDVADWGKLTDWQRLEQEFASAILDPDPTVAAYAMASAAPKPSPAGGPVLKAALRQREAGEPWWLSRMATMRLVAIGDLDALYSLKAMEARWSTQPKRSVPMEVTDLVASTTNSISVLRSRNAVPALVELSMDPEPSVRYAATVALGAIGGSDTKAALAARLGDEDPEVCHAASWGLGTGLEPRDVGAKDWSGWLPAANIYDKDPDKVLNNWRRWWSQKGKAKYPSVQAELAKAERFRTERPWAHKDAGNYPSVEAVVAKAELFRKERPWAKAGQDQAAPETP